jgi:hypothetical protein
VRALERRPMPPFGHFSLTGIVKAKPISWKNMFFPQVYDLEGD